MALDTGNGATITFATSGFTASFIMLGGHEMEVPDINISHLGTTTSERFQPGDLVNRGEFEGEFFWNGTTTPPTVGQVSATVISENVTVTGPTAPGGSSGPIWAGKAYIKKLKTADYQNNEMQKGKITIKWDGQTTAAGAGGPAYTAAT